MTIPQTDQAVAVPAELAEKIQAYRRALDGLDAVIALEANEAYRRQLLFLRGYVAAGYAKALKQVAA